MKFIASFVTLAAVAAAQNLSSLPSCALNALIPAIGSTGCATTDIACICKSTAFVQAASSQLAQACPSPTDQAAAIAAANAICAAVGVTLPQAGGSNPTTSTTSAAPTTAATSAASATTSAAAVTDSGVAIVATTSYTTICTSTWASNYTTTYSAPLFTGAAATPIVNWAAAAAVGVAALFAV